MTRVFLEQYPRLNKAIKRQYLTFLNNYLKKDNFIYYNSDLDIRIKLFTKDLVSKDIFLDSYENETILALKRLIMPGDVIYDIGANFGYYSLIFSKLTGCDGKVHSFEPSHREFLALAENVRINHINNIYLNQLAVSNSSGMVEMSIFDDQVYGVYNTLGSPVHHNIEKQTYRAELVRTITLDDYCTMFGAQNPSIIKIDVEGSELNVLENGKVLLSHEDAPVLVLEICEETLSGMGVVPTQVVKLLKEYAYSLFSIRRDGSLVSIDEKKSMNVIAVKQNSFYRLKQTGLFSA